MTNKNTTPNEILFSVSALAALMLAASTVAAFVSQPAAAQNTSIPTSTQQTQACDTAGSASSISISCNGISNNNVANSPNPNPPSAEIRCPTDYTLSQGLCTAQPICPSGAPPNSLGQCITTTDVGSACPAGLVFNSLGFICFILVPPVLPCPPGTTSNPHPVCQGPTPACSSGVLNRATGRCEITTSTPATCPGGITPTSGQCITKPS